MPHLPTPPGWNAFSLTFVVYPQPENFIQEILFQYLSLMCMLPIFYFLFAFFILVFRREVSGLYLMILQLGTEISNQILKRLIQEPRPSPLRATSYGRPSSHSQHAWFCFILFWILSTFHSKPRSQAFSWYDLFLFYVGAFLSFSTTAARVIFGYHTYSQVLEGGILGFISGVFAGYIILSPWFQVSITQKLINLLPSLYLRDTFPNPQTFAKTQKIFALKKP